MDAVLTILLQTNLPWCIIAFVIGFAVCEEFLFPHRRYDGMSSKEFGKGFQSVKETPSVVSVSSIMGGGVCPH